MKNIRTRVQVLAACKKLGIEFNDYSTGSYFEVTLTAPVDHNFGFAHEIVCHCDNSIIKAEFWFDVLSEITRHNISSCSPHCSVENFDDGRCEFWEAG